MPIPKGSNGNKNDQMGPAPFGIFHRLKCDECTAASHSGSLCSEPGTPQHDVRAEHRVLKCAQQNRRQHRAWNNTTTNENNRCGGVRRYLGAGEHSHVHRVPLSAWRSVPFAMTSPAQQHGGRGAPQRRETEGGEPTGAEEAGDSLTWRVQARSTTMNPICSLQGGKKSYLPLQYNSSQL